MEAFERFIPDKLLLMHCNNCRHCHLNVAHSIVIEQWFANESQAKCPYRFWTPVRPHPQEILAAKSNHGIRNVLEYVHL